MNVKVFIVFKCLKLASCILLLNLVFSEAEPNWQDCPKDEAKNIIDCSDFGLTKIPLAIYDSSWRNMLVYNVPVFNV
jgi:hypothetical protein